MSCEFSLYGWPSQDYAPTTLPWNSFNTSILQHLLSPVLTPGLSRNRCCDRMTVGLKRGVLHRIAIIRWSPVVGGSLLLLSASLSQAQTPTQHRQDTPTPTPTPSPTPTPGQVSLAWAPDTDPSVVGYNLYYTTNPTALVAGQVPPIPGTLVKIRIASATMATLSGLSSGSQFWFGITAYNTNGIESALSNVVNTKVP